jgi:phenylalanyl-tRNA synthetase alpha chain
MLKTGSWKDKEFRHYKADLEVPILDIGRRHPMMEANNVIRDVFVEMGFKEMQGPIIESEFWCFDALWIPQDHPARDDQDTFFLDGKAKVPTDYKEKVKTMHEEGIKRTHTAKDDFSDEITSRRILRTHSTATTFRTLHELSQKEKRGEDINGKYFYCAHNFRNEAIDATHLAEFFQAEGFIIGDNLSLADLMGFVKEYYAKLGITQIRFKPTFNPYTEPSMEAHYYDPKMDKWYALINSGIFRPETLKPLGLENKTIIAWGMGATRVAALLSKANNLRELTGTTCDLEWLKTRPLMNRTIVNKGGKK